MHSHDVGTSEILDVLDHVGKTAVLEEFIVEDEILNFGDRFLAIGKLGLGNGDVFHNRHAGRVNLTRAHLLESFATREDQRRPMGRFLPSHKRTESVRVLPLRPDFE